MTKFLGENVFKGRAWPVDDVRTCLQYFHRNMRSAFVHQARLVLGRDGKGHYTGPLWPSKDSLISEETIHAEALLNVKSLARLAILFWLSKYESAFSAKLAAEVAGYRVLRFPGLWQYRIGPVSVHLGIPRPAEFGPDGDPAPTTTSGSQITDAAD